MNEQANERRVISLRANQEEEEEKTLSARGKHYG